MPRSPLTKRQRDWLRANSQDPTALPALDIRFWENGYAWRVAGENLAPDDIRAEDFDHSLAMRDELAGRITESSMSTVHKRRARAELDMLWARAPLPPGYDVCLSDYGGGWVPVKVDAKGRMLPGSAAAVQHRAAPRGRFVTLDSAISRAWEVYDQDEADMAADEAADARGGDHA